MRHLVFGIMCSVLSPLVLFACGSDETSSDGGGETAGTAGAAGSGAIAQAGRSTATGGSNSSASTAGAAGDAGSAANVTSAGSPGSSGSSAVTGSGGSTASAGSAGAGDSTGSGGRTGSGGMTATGGRTGSGGMAATGGRTGSGGQTGASGSGGQPGSAGSDAQAGSAGAPPSTATGGIEIAGGAGSCDASPTLRLAGNQILDTSGTPIVVRGPEMVVADADNTGGIDTAGGMGANGARFLLTLDALNGMTPATFDALLTRAAQNHMIVWLSLYSWNDGANYQIGDSLGGGNFYSLEAPAGTGTCNQATPGPCYLALWSRQWLKDLVANHQNHVIVDAMQEYIGLADPDTDAGRDEWASAAMTNIEWFRNAGYTVPLEIMSNYEGRDLYAIVERGEQIRAADSRVVNGEPQTMFGWQAYWGTDDNWYPTWQGSLFLGGGNTLSGAEALHRYAIVQPFPIQIGFDNYSGDTNLDYGEQMEQADADGASWLWWSWRWGDDSVECPTSGASCQELVTNSEIGFAGAVASECIL